MPEKALLIETLTQIHGATERIIKRFEPIQSPDDFLENEAGHEKLDAICMQLIAIGESLKNIDKITDKKLLPNYPAVDWKSVKGMRDIISHHYFDLNAEAVYDVCKNDIHTLKETVEQMINDNK
ncbi:MAG: DUF86 domain-containing protein [Sulfuricurvum sp.]|uniref:HepT-like ribonuclease domain-containing protein n=1 Tax=Sulfuricurvum sp. TaxID=2025608 RepID=UPI00261EF1F1|nr:DUF86 domain-containing protein [Sulfuricurvum sp.]MDD5158712.1 DUF86 domain-containing protein [Sulfuricurvum sp.]MDD5160222.1 DUF86 domain-containing protein [Sulfuricurvum sp.]